MDTICILLHPIHWNGWTLYITATTINSYYPTKHWRLWSGIEIKFQQRAWCHKYVWELDNIPRVSWVPPSVMAIEHTTWGLGTSSRNKLPNDKCPSAWGRGGRGGRGGRATLNKSILILTHRDLDSLMRWAVGWNQIQCHNGFVWECTVNSNVSHGFQQKPWTQLIPCDIILIHLSLSLSLWVSPPLSRAKVVCDFCGTGTFEACIHLSAQCDSGRIILPCRSFGLLLRH